MRKRGWRGAILRFVNLIAVGLCLVVAQAAADQSQSVRVVVDGKVLQPNSTQVIADKVYIALRPLAQVLGAEISTDHTANTVTITTLLRQVVFRINDKSALVNGQPVQLDTAPQNVGGRVLVPLRALAATFGAVSSYRSQDHSVVIATNPNAIPSTRVAARPPVARTTTINGSVSAVHTDANPPSVDVAVNDLKYTITVPAGMHIEFRDVHGAVTGQGFLAQVSPGDALIATLDPNSQLIAIADIFASTTGSVAAVSGQSLVLSNGKVITADPSGVTVTLDGQAVSFSSLQPGDKVSVRADPISGRVRDVEALRPPGTAASGPSPTASAQSSNGTVRISSVVTNAQRALRAGQVLRVAANGTSGAQAQFDLSNIIAGNSLRETYPGHYEGQYVVSVGTNLTDAPILVRLTKNGAVAVAQAPDPLTIVTTPPTVKETAPAASQQINNLRPNIFASFSTTGDKGMDPSSLRMLVNGRDVTAQATRTAVFISYLPSSGFSAGTVLVEVQGTDIAGNTLQYRWSFAIVGK